MNVDWGPETPHRTSIQERTERRTCRCGNTSLPSKAIALLRLSRVDTRIRLGTVQSKLSTQALELLRMSLQDTSTAPRRRKSYQPGR
jgi:hypothetical protein